MKRCIISIALLIVLSLMLAGCSEGNSNITDTNSAAIETDTGTITPSAEDAADMFTNRDYEIGYDEKEAVNIILSGNSVACDSDSVIIDGNCITVTNEGSYIITGELNDGMIIVDAENTDKPQLILNNVTVNSSSSAALYIKEADKVFVTLADNSQNSLSNGGEFENLDENNIDGAIFSKQDLTFNGNGSLEITSPVAHGIVCKDDLVITSGNYEITSASHGVDANDSIRIANAQIDINAGKDGMHVENTDNTEKGFFYYLSGTANITAEGDGISASLYAKLCGGDISIVSGGGSINGTNKSSENYGGFMGGGPGGFDPYSTETDADEDSVSMKGIKADKDISVNGCNIKVDSADDSIHSNASVNVNSGNINISSGDDAIHAEETLTVNDGTIEITESYEGLEAVNILVNGGDISLVSSDDGLNAAGGKDESGFGGRDNGNFGGGRDGMGGSGVGFGGQGSSNGSIVISGGNLYIEASGDGIDSNGYLEITGGYTEVCGPTVGDTAVLDYDTTAEITGGTFIGTGSYMMAQTFSSSENQGVLALSVGNQEAGTEIIICDSDGNEILKHSPKLSYAILVYSSPDIKTGETYQISVGSQSGEFQAS